MITKKIASNILIACSAFAIGFFGSIGYFKYSANSNVKIDTEPTIVAQDKKTGMVENTTEIPSEETATAPETADTATPSPAQPAPTAPAQATPRLSMTIKGDASCQSATNAALNLLKSKAPDHHKTVMTYIGVIECAPQGSGMFAYEDPPRYLVGDETRNAGTIWYAGTIVHDAIHSKLYHTHPTTNGYRSVPDAVWTGGDAEKACLDVQYDALTKLGASKSQLDHVKNALDSKYWEVPYDQRTW